MPNYTKNYNIKKPLPEEFYNIEDSNENMDIIDTALKVLEDTKANGVHTHTKSDIGLGNVDNIQQATKTEFNNHNTDTAKHITGAERTTWNGKADGVHTHVKTDVGLSNVDNVQQATKTEFNGHNTDTVKHLTTSERIEFSKNQKSTTLVIGIQGVHNVNECDYLADNSVGADVAIRQAIENIPNGGKIIIREGEYNIKRAIYAYNDTAIEGCGRRTVLNKNFSNASADNYYGVIHVAYTSAKISNLLINGNQTIYSSSYDCAISLTNTANNSVISDVIVCNSNVGILTYGSLILILHNVIYNCGIAISITNANNILVVDNIVYDNVVAGIYADYSTDISVCNNICRNNDRAAICVSVSNNNTITGNTCIRGTGLASDYGLNQYSLLIGGNYNNVTSNLIMGKIYSYGGTGNNFANNKYTDYQYINDGTHIVNTSATGTVSLILNNTYNLTATGAVSLVLPTYTVPLKTEISVKLQLSGAYSVSFPTGIKWSSGGIPPFVVGKTYEIIFTNYGDGWLGGVVIYE